MLRILWSLLRYNYLASDIFSLLLKSKKIVSTIFGLQSHQTSRYIPLVHGWLYQSLSPHVQNKHYGIWEVAGKWFGSYLSSRKQTWFYMILMDHFLQNGCTWTWAYPKVVYVFLFLLCTNIFTSRRGIFTSHSVCWGSIIVDTMKWPTFFINKYINGYLQDNWLPVNIYKTKAANLCGDRDGSEIPMKQSDPWGP